MQSGNETSTNDNVVKFPVVEQPPMVLACMFCDNQIFFLHQSGDIQCSACHGVLKNVRAELIQM